MGLPLRRKFVADRPGAERYQSPLESCPSKADHVNESVSEGPLLVFFQLVVLNCTLATLLTLK